MSNLFESKSVYDTFQYPQGYFSIKDTIDSILKTQDGKVFFNELTSFAKSTLGFTLTPAMLSMARNMTVEQLFRFAGDKMPTNVKLVISERLNKIKK